MDVAREMKAWIARNKPSAGKPMSAIQIEEGVRLLVETPRESVNTVVYNQMLSLIGREGKLERMWRLFNDVSDLTKARGI
jgi:pentatricopeptide repeat protein